MCAIKNALFKTLKNFGYGQKAAQAMQRYLLMRVSYNLIIKMEQMLGGPPVKNKIAKRTFSLIALFAFVLGCVIMMVPLRAGAAQAGAGTPATEKRIEWTAIEAEIAREFSEGVPLRNIINDTVRSGEKIPDVVATCIKVGIDPSLVVYTGISEGYAARTIVRAARKAGAPLNAVVNSATHAGVDEKSAYVGDIVEAAIKNGEDPSLVVYIAITEGYSAQTVIRAARMAGASLSDVIKSAAHAGPDNKSAYSGEVVSAAIKTGQDPSLVVQTAITQGYPVQIVVRAAMRAGTPLETVVNAATKAGADKKSIYAGAADTEASPGEVEGALVTAKTPGASVFISGPPTAAAPASLALAPAPAVFGRGGIVLSQVPAWAPPTLIVGPLKINPFFAISETFSDNITYTQNDKKSDSITTVTPGLRLQLPFQTHVAELEYYSVLARYGKYTEENITDNHIGGSVDFKVGDSLELQLSDNYDIGHEPRSSTPTGTNEVFHYNVAAASASYRLTDRFTARLDYGRSTWHFITDHFRDRDEDQLTGAVFYRVLPNASVFIEYGHRNINYVEETPDLDSTVGTMQAGLTWDFSSRSKGTIKAGLARKDFTSSAWSNGTVRVWSADVRHDFVSDTMVVLTAQHSMNEPEILDINYFVSTGAYAEVTQRFVQKWAAVVRVAYVQDENTIRTDRTALSGAGLRYRAKDWLEFALDYNRRKRQSNVQGNDYTEQSSILTVNVSL